MGLSNIPLIAGTAKAMGSQREEGRPVSFLLLCPAGKEEIDKGFVQRGGAVHPDFLHHT